MLPSGGDEQDRQNRIAQTDAVEKMNERHANLAAAMTVKVLEKLKGDGCSGHQGDDTRDDAQER